MITTTHKKNYKKEDIKIKPHRRSDLISLQPKEIQKAYSIEFDIALEELDKIWITENKVGWSGVFLFVVAAWECIHFNLPLQKTWTSGMAYVIATVVISIMLTFLASIMPSMKKNKEKHEENMLAWNIFNEKVGYLETNKASVEEMEIMQTERFQKAINSYKKKALRASKIAQGKTQKRLSEIEKEQEEVIKKENNTKTLKKITEQRLVEQKIKKEETEELRSGLFGKV